jgi:hypothetical protein
MIDTLAENWVTVAIVLGALAVGWWLITTVLRLTRRVFTLGCAGLILLAVVLWGMNWLGG